MILASFFFAATPLVIITCLFSMISLDNFFDLTKLSTTKQTNAQVITRSGARVFASVPSNVPSILGYATSADARSEIIRQYLEYYNSPLVNYADYIVQTSDKYNIDFRLTTAIAQQESNLCKIIPPGSYNCWGWGIHSKGSLGFSSFAEGIETVSEGLKTEYIDKGFLTTQQIMAKYTPLSNGSWASGVDKFLTEME